MTADDLDRLRADAENPMIAPSRRVAARKALRAMREGDDAEVERARLALAAMALAGVAGRD